MGHFRIAGFVVLGTILGSSVACAQTELDLDAIEMPPGFSIEIWADDVPNARSLTLGDNGTVFVATRRDGRVYALVPAENTAPSVVTLAENLVMPNGIAFHDGALYVAENHRITRYDDIEASLPEVPEANVVIDTLSTERHHGWRYIDFGPDGKLYIAIGAPCNVCDREGFANISRMNADGSGQEVVASGVRNSVGFAWHPETARANSITRLPRACTSASPIATVAIFRTRSLAIKAIVQISSRPHRSSDRMSPHWACCSTPVQCFRTSTRDKSSLPNTDPGTAARRLDIAFPWSGWCRENRPDTRILPPVGCTMRRSRDGRSTCWYSQTVRCYSATIKMALSTGLVTAGQWTKV